MRGLVGGYGLTGFLDLLRCIGVRMDWSGSNVCDGYGKFLCVSGACYGQCFKVRRTVHRVGIFAYIRTYSCTALRSDGRDGTKALD